MACYEFGVYYVDTRERRLQRGDERIPLTPKVFETLELLIEAGGKVVDRETFHARLWPDTNVEDRNLTVNISTLRKALGGGESDYVETVPKLGYRLRVAVRVVDRPETLLTAEFGTPPTSPAVEGGTWGRRHVRFAFVSGLLIGLIALGMISFKRDGESPPTPTSLAVLPFNTIGLPEGEGYLSVGIADALIAQLSSLHDLVVRPTSSIQNIGTDRDPLVVGRRLQVGHVLDAMIQRDGNRLKVSAQLIDVARGIAVWSERFEQQEDSIFELQDMIVARVAARLVPQLAAAAQAAAQRYRPSSAEAYRLQIEARARLSTLSRDDTLRARSLFERAVALDPQYAHALAGLASTYAMLTSTIIGRPIPVDQGMRLARETAARALAIDPDNGEAIAVRGLVKFTYDWDWAGAEDDLRRAVDVSPGSAEAHESYGWFLVSQGRIQDGLMQLGQARALNPVQRQTIELIGLSQWIAGQPELALASLREASELDPDAPRPHFRRMVVLTQMQRTTDAMAARADWLTRFDSPGVAQTYERLLATEGERAMMERWIALLERLEQTWEAADQLMAIGEQERAVEALERCEAERCTSLPFVAVHNSFKPLAGNPRFDALLSRMRLKKPA